MICNRFLFADEPRWLLIGWQREQKVSFFRHEWVCDCCCWTAAVKGWLHDVKMEQCEHRSHKGTTSPAHGGTSGVFCVCLLGGGAKWETVWNREVETCKEDKQAVKYEKKKTANNAILVILTLISSLSKNKVLEVNKVVTFTEGYD